MQKSPQPPRIDGPSLRRDIHCSQGIPVLPRMNGDVLRDLGLGSGSVIVRGQSPDGGMGMNQTGACCSDLPSFGFHKLLLLLEVHRNRCERN